MPPLIPRRAVAAALLTAVAVTACSATADPGPRTSQEVDVEDFEAPSSQAAGGGDVVVEPSAEPDSADAETPAAAGVGEPADDTGEPARSATPTEQPSGPFQDVPEGYYVVNDGRAMVPERGGDGCEGMPSLEPRDNHQEDRVHGYWYSGLRDLGPSLRASGEATYDEDGQPVAYVAAPGDTMTAIAARFCIDHLPYLEWINAIRRGEETSLLSMRGSMPLYAGDTINLSPYTIASVGDENGVVRNNEIDFDIPPQR